MSANAEIILEEKKAVLIVPESAVLYDKERKPSLEVPDPKGRGRQAQGRGEARHLERGQDRARRGAEGRRQGRPAVGAPGVDAMVFERPLPATRCGRCCRAQAAHAAHHVRHRLGHRVDHADGGGGRGAARGPGEGGGRVRQGRHDRLRGPHQPAGGRACAPAGASSGRRPTTSEVQPQSPVVRLRDARARAGRPRAQRLQQRLAHDHRLAAGLRLDPLDPGGRGPLPELGRRDGRCGAWRFLGSDAKKQLFGSRPAMGETIRIGDFPYTVVGVMRAQGAGLELRRARHQQGVPALQRDPAGLPEQAAVAPGLGRPPARRPALAWPTTRPARPSCAGRSARIHAFDPRDEEAATIWDTVEEAKAFRTMTDGMKYFLGAVGHRDALHRRHRGDERDAGGGARADARDRRPQGARRHARGRSSGSSSWRR